MSTLALRSGNYGTSTVGLAVGVEVIARAKRAFGFFGQGTDAGFVETRTQAVTSEVPELVVEPEVTGVGPQVHRLRRLSGLTWEDLAHALGVSRRTVHSWANGGAVKVVNATHLTRCMEVIECAPWSSATATRPALLAPRGLGGERAIDFLKNGRYREAESAMLRYDGKTEPVSGLPTQPHPRAFLGALQDPIAPSSGSFKRVVRLNRKR